MKYRVHVTTFEDDGAHWVRLQEHRTDAPLPGSLPYLGHSLTFCGTTPAAAKQRAVDFVRDAAAAMRGGES